MTEKTAIILFNLGGPDDLAAVKPYFAAFTARWPDVEALAAAALIAGVVFGIRILMEMLRREAHLEQQLGLAAGAFHDIVAQHFETWGLTPSEQDVALLTLKGLAIPEIAHMRGNAEGTVKAHLGAIYRKAGVSGRGAFLAYFIEELMEAAPAPS